MGAWRAAFPADEHARPTTRWCKSLFKRRTELGGKPKIAGFIAVADCAHYAGAGVDAMICGATGDGFHGTDEYVDIASMDETTKTLAAAIIDWCGVR